MLPSNFWRPSTLVLLVADFLHPVGAFAVELFYDGDVCHRRGGSSTVPVLLSWRDPDHVPRPNLLNRPSPSITVTGRKSGRVISNPVWFVLEDDKLYLLP